MAQGGDFETRCCRNHSCEILLAGQAGSPGQQISQVFMKYKAHTERVLIDTNALADGLLQRTAQFSNGHWLTFRGRSVDAGRSFKSQGIELGSVLHLNFP